MRRDSSFILCRFAVFIAVAAFGVGGALGQDSSAVDGPDPNEIPVPEIVTSLGTMPGVTALPIRKELPDVLVMEDGARVTSAEPWAKRRAEVKRVLEYYAIGSMPPAPGNVSGMRSSRSSCLMER